MKRLLLIFILILGLAVVGCSKDDEEIEAIEKEAAEDEATAVMDSLEGVGDQSAQEVGYVDSMATQAQTEPEPAITEPEPEPEPDYSDIAGYVVQVGSYTDRELAEWWAARYQNWEYPAFLRTVDIDGETIYRLRIGVYETFDDAKQIGELLVDRYSATYWIDNNR
jgi:cell division septation protein DedD